MAETEAQKANRLKEWREKRAAKRAQTGDTPEKQSEGKKQADPNAKDNATRAGLGGIAGGGIF